MGGICGPPAARLPCSVPFAACMKDFVFETFSLDPKQAKAVQRLRNHQVRHTTVLWRGEEERKTREKEGQTEQIKLDK